MRLPIYIPDLPEQKYSCHGCGSCCRDFTVQLTEADLQKLHNQGWAQRMPEGFAVDFRGQKWLKQKPDGACVFLGDNGLCKVHAEFGLEAKPLACQFFPFMLSPHVRNTNVGVSFACGSVVASKGAPLESHRRDVIRMSELLPASAPMAAMLKNKIFATESEEKIIQGALDEWLAQKQISPATRYEGFAWIVTSLCQARLERMRGENLRLLMQTLASVVEQELPLLDWPAPPQRAWKLLRQALFARIEDPKIGDLIRQGKLRSIMGQWSRSRRWASGKGKSPVMPGVPSIEFGKIDSTEGIFHGNDAQAMDNLLQRWLRASILGGRAWGSGLYDLPIDRGLGFVMVNLLCAMWLARFRAAARGERVASLADLEYAVGRIDRTSGRARWLASEGERLRVSWLVNADALRLLTRALASNA